MKTYDLKPTYENLLEAYRNDSIGRNADVFHFTSILDSIEGACSIAIDGNWGSGKTFFVKQVKMVMDAHNSFISTDNDERSEIVSIRKKHYRQKEFDLQPQICVYYDAWENDNDSDPIMSLIFSILNSVDSDFSFINRDCLKIGASIMEVFTGRAWMQVISEPRGDSPLDSIKGQKGTKELVDAFLESLLPEKGNRLVIIIDELDRCKPSYAVRLLERIKHYFDHDRITFVFSVNTNELHHTVKKYYGDGFDGSRYLDRFFDLRVTLPPPNLKNFYFNLGFNNTHYIYDVVCDSVIKAHHFELREIARFLRLAKVAAHDATHGNSQFLFPEEKAIQFCLVYIVPIMIGLKLRSAQRYDDFIQGIDHTPLIEILNHVKLYGIFNELLSSGESYADGNNQTVHVTVADKLKKVYDAIFVQNYEGTVYETMIGALKFTTDTKDILMRTAGLFSKYTNPNLD